MLFSQVPPLLPIFQQPYCHSIIIEIELEEEKKVMNSLMYQTCIPPTWSSDTFCAWFLTRGSGILYVYFKKNISIISCSPYTSPWQIPVLYYYNKKTAQATKRLHIVQGDLMVRDDVFCFLLPLPIQNKNTISRHFVCLVSNTNYFGFIRGRLQFYFIF